jgi:hypothetical protein
MQHRLSVLVALLPATIGARAGAQPTSCPPPPLRGPSELLAGAVPVLQCSTGSPTRVWPVQVAWVRMVDGRAVAYGWRPYIGAGSDATWVRAFDCFESDETGWPIGGEDCGDGEAEDRWWYGPNFYCPSKTEDMTPKAEFRGAYSERIGLAWAWETRVATSCVVAIFTFDSFGACVLPDRSDPLDDGVGVAIDFGELDPGAAYIADVDLQASGKGWTMPGAGGAYFLQFLSDEAGELVLAREPCQMMLWGTGDAGGTEGGAGTQGPFAWDDVAHPDGEITGDECVNYAGLVACPDPLGGMIQFWVDDSRPGCYPDLHADGALDLFDFLEFTNLFSSGDDVADCEADGVLDLFDFLCFTNAFNAGC